MRRTTRSTVSPLASLATAAALAFSLAPAARAADIVTKAVDLGTLAVPGSTRYGSVFGAGQIASTDTFYEDYQFTVPDASFASLTATLSLADVLNINNLQVRLYTGTLGSTTVGAVLTPQQLLSKWSTAVASGQGSGQQQVIAPMDLGAGSYILEVRGQVTGSAGGGYVGLVNVSAVPEPHTYALFAAGLLTVGLLMARRRGGG